ncbi:MAG: MFS transporter [Verrucomicrobia bacterium]|nr:MFS transporter [Verrucomicrobiota bacterium]
MPSPLPPSGVNRLFLILSINFALFGASMTVFGATLPEIIRAMDWSYLVAGVIIASNSFAYFMTTFVSGMMVHRIGLARLMFGGLLLQGLGIGMFGTTRSTLLNLGAFMLVGIGQGAIEIVTNFSVVQMEARGRSRLMNLVHSAFTVGAILAPFLTGALISRGIEWRSIYIGLAATSFAMMGVFGLPAARFQTFDGGHSPGQGGTLQILKHPALLLLALTMFLYVGAEIGISSWISEFFVTQFKLPPSTAAYLVSLFWLGILLGRLGTSFLYKGNQQARLLLIFSLGSAISLGTALLTRSAAASASLFFCTGLGFSTIYPTVITIVGDRYAHARGVAIGFVSTAGGIGMCVFPFIMSGIANQTELRSGFWFYLLVTLLMTATTAAAFWRTKTHPRANDTTS